jgi:hypothetical protein
VAVCRARTTLIDPVGLNPGSVGVGLPAGVEAVDILMTLGAALPPVALDEREGRADAVAPP